MGTLLKIIGLLTIVAALFIGSAGVLIAALHSNPFVWNAATEDDPTATDAVQEGDDHFREVREALRLRLEPSMHFGTITGAEDDGRMVEGTARIFSDTTANLPDVNTGRARLAYDNGAVGSNPDVPCDGTMFHSTDDGYLEILEGGVCTKAGTIAAAEWKPAVGGFDTDVHLDDVGGGSTPMKFLRDGTATEDIDIFSHAERHQELVEAGTAGLEWDYLDYLIVGIQTTGTIVDSTTSTTAGAVATITWDRTSGGTRRAESEAIVVCSTSWNGNNAVSGGVTIQQWICDEGSTDCAVDSGNQIAHSIQRGGACSTLGAASCAAADFNIVSWAHITNAAAVSNDIDCVVDMVTGTGTLTVLNTSMFLVDLGLEDVP